MGPEYSQDVFYRLSNQEKVNVSNLNYHLAFSNMVSQDDKFYATWINPELTKAFVCTNYMATDFDNLNSNATWRELHNQDTSWGKGAFSQGTEKHPRYTWASYAGNGDLRGDSIYKIQLKDTSTGNFDIEMKLWLKQRLSDNGSRTWTIKYGKIDNSWDTTLILTDLALSKGNFMYYDFINKKEIKREPETKNWDFVFTRYSTFTQGLQYTVTGLLNNYNVECWKIMKPIAEVVTNDLVGLNWNSKINAIGYDWKYFNRMTSKYELEQNTTRIIKIPSGMPNVSNIYAIQFVKFEGRSTGKIVFDYKYLGEISSVKKEVPLNFSLFPNPAQDKLYFTSDAAISSIEITDLQGRKVLNIINNNKEINIQHLNPGIYIASFMDVNNVSWQVKFVKE